MVYAIGSNGAFQLGVGHNRDVSVPEKTFFTHADDVVSGGNHTVFLVDKVAYLVGSIGDIKHKKPIPVPILNGERVQWKLAACGWEFVILIDESNQVYALGKGSHGELGLGPNVHECVTATPLVSFGPLNKSIVDIKAGMNHVVVLLDDGSVWGWGASSKGQLGNPAKAMARIWTPIEVIHDLDFRHCSAIACGRDFSVVCNLRSGHIKVIGRQRKEWQDLPRVIHNIKQIGSGWSCIHVLKHDGSVESWGNNSHSQVTGHNNSRARFTSMACGTEHVVALDSHHRIWTWGWGEHGNCGKEGLKTHNEHTIDEGEHSAVFAGHANTWFI